MKNLLTLLFATVLTFTIQGQYLVSYELLSSIPAWQLNIVPGVNAEYDVDFYKVLYNTVDGNGNPTVASGGFAVPQSTDCEGFPMAVYQHGTVLNKEDVPSRDAGAFSIEKSWASKGFYVAAPDFIGMGDNPGLHPYLHAESEATAARDLIRAGREILQELNATENHVDNGEVFVLGYSQGGHAAMAFHKHIEENGLLDEFNILGSAPASGPYDLSGIQLPGMVSNEIYTNPGYIVYLIAGYDVVYDNIYDEYSDFLNAPYDDIVVPYFDGNNTIYGMGDLNPLLNDTIATLLNPDYFDALINDPDNALSVALEENNVFDWQAQRPVRMYYCTQDEQVNYQNALSAEEAMINAGSTDVEAIDMGDLNHGGCAIPAMLNAANWMYDLKSGCQPVSVEELEINMNIYPNPTSDFVRIEIDNLADRVEIVSINGQLVETLLLNRSIEEIDMKNYQSGSYIFNFYLDGKFVGGKSVVKK